MYTMHTQSWPRPTHVHSVALSDKDEGFDDDISIAQMVRYSESTVVDDGFVEENSCLK